MFRKNFKIITMFLTILFLFGITQIQAKTHKIDVVYGNNVNTTEMLLIKGSGYLRAKDIEKFYRSQFMYFQVSRKIIFNFGKNRISFSQDSNVVNVNNEKRLMNKNCIVKNDEFYVPLEVLLTKTFKENSGYKASWNFERRLLHIESFKPVLADKDEETEDEIAAAESQPSFDKEDEEKEEKNEEGKTVLVKKEEVEITEEEDIALFDEEEEKVEEKAKEDEIALFEEKKEKFIELIVIDAGHGGKDPGAVGLKKTMEKDLNLSVALKLKKILKKYGKKVILTRGKDVFIPLRDRVKVANEKEADLFISIHANAALNRTKRGFEVYILSENASDIEAQDVAALENAALEYEDYTQDDLDTILLSMSLNSFMNESNEFAYFVNREVTDNIKIMTRGVKQAGFVVLKGARMPSVLVEMSYLSNPKDEKLLNTKSFKGKMAESIAISVLEYERHLKNNLVNEADEVVNK